MRGLASATLLLGAASAGAEGVYKWVDSQGRLHFGGTPPLGTKAERVNTPPPAEPASNGATKTWQEQVDLSGQRKRLAQEQEQKTSQQRSEYQQRCNDARWALDTLNRERPIYRVNAQGEREYMEDGQRQAARDAANQRVATYCQ